MTGETHRGTDGPVAICSKLRWLLSGAVDSTYGGANVYTHLILTNKLNSIPEVQDPINPRNLRKFEKLSQKESLRPVIFLRRTV